MAMNETLEQRRSTLVNALRAGKGWMTDYAEAFVDQYVEDAHLTQPAQAVDVGGDTRRIDHLERLIQCAYLGACFELDGGIHLTIEAPGSEPVAYRYKNNLREAIDADIASGGDHQA